MILAVESSCDETALALVDELGHVHFNICLSQIALHKKYGGVVPELASRSHFDALDVFSEKIAQEKLDISKITAVAATMGPGLIGPLLVGSSFARGLAAAWQKPFIGVHHLRAHVASALLSDSKGVSLKERAQQIFPSLVLLVSGGHCMLLKVTPSLECEILKTTSDDAAGECFDKCAKLIGLPYPGGPSIQEQSLMCTQPSDIQLAADFASKLPRPKSSVGFSFAGLKTAFRLLVEQDDRARKNIPALSRALEITISDTLLSVLKKVADEHDVGQLICCGGVSANLHLRKDLEHWAKQRDWNLHTVPLAYSTDNAVMIAVAALVQGESLSEETVFPRGHL
ncbi:MAG: tRNA (adenosine(37)-N6)-threonylcarbamoyltransferase complex transferase subunit TsaD [Bdellovibrionota bacterium]